MGLPRTAYDRALERVERALDMEAALHSYSNKPYGYLLRWYEEKDEWLGVVVELPGCVVHSSGDEGVSGAVYLLEKAFQGWLKTALEEGREIPEPGLPARSSRR